MEFKLGNNSNNWHLRSLNYTETNIFKVELGRSPSPYTSRQDSSVTQNSCYRPKGIVVLHKKMIVYLCFFVKVAQLWQ